MKVLNLDAACAALGYKLGTSGTKPKDTENRITKALGVLEEQGGYAMFLYLHAREKKKFSVDLMEFLRNNIPGTWSANRDNEPFGRLGELAKNIDNLLFARELLHQVLVYARYHAKAAGASVAEVTASTDNGKGPSGNDREEPSQRNDGHVQTKGGI